MFNLHQSKRSTLSCQAWNLIEPRIEEKAVDDLEKYFSSCTNAQRNVINVMVSFHSTCPEVMPSEKTIARHAGVSVKTVERTKRKLKRDGILVSNYRHKRSCQYKLPRFFHKPWVRKLLSSIIPAFKIIPLFVSFLLSQSINAKTSQSSQIENVVHINQEKYKKNISSYIRTSNVRETQKNSSFQNGKTKGIGEVLGSMFGGVLQKCCDKFGDPSQYQKKQPEKQQPVKKVEKNDKNLIEKGALKVKEFPITKWGQIRLCAFPSWIIAEARLSYMEQNKNLLGLPAFTALYNHALKHCRDEGVEPDWQRVQALMKHFKQPDNAPMVLPQQPLQQKVQPKPYQPPQKYMTKEERKEKQQFKREAYRPFIPQEIKKSEDLIYINYFFVEENKNPLFKDFNPHKNEYFAFRKKAAEETGTSEENIHQHLYDLYLAHPKSQKGKSNGRDNKAD